MKNKDVKEFWDKKKINYNNREIFYFTKEYLFLESTHKLGFYNRNVVNMITTIIC